jgi:hypothetical protein
MDLPALRADLFRAGAWVAPGPEDGHVKAALRLEGGRLVEVREGNGESRPPGFSFDSPEAVAAAWDWDGDALWPALRSGLLEPIPSLLSLPIPPLQPLPGTSRDVAEDRYLVRIDKPPAAPGAPWDEGDLRAWRGLLAKRPAGAGDAGSRRTASARWRGPPRRWPTRARAEQPSSAAAARSRW